MEVGVLHGMVTGLTVLTALAVGLLLARTPRFWLHDDSHLARWRAFRIPHGPWPVLAGILIAVGAAGVFQLTVLAPATGWAASAPLSATTLTAVHPNSADRIVSGLFLGLAAGVTPFLILADVIVRRLPDRIVYPTMLAGAALLIVGSVSGQMRFWFTAFFAGLLALVLFGLLHLLGRVLRTQTMGLGDVKLAFLVFAVAGLYDPWAPPLVLVVMMLIAGVWALIGAIRARRLRGVTIAFGPAMLSGMWLGSVLAPILL